MLDGEHLRIAARRRVVVSLAIGATITIALAGCFPAPTRHRAEATHTESPSTTASAATTTHPPVATVTATASPEPAPNPAISHPATAEPVNRPVPPPTLAPVPKGTIVAQGDVASPKGSIHFGYRMVSDGDNTYSAEYSSFSSTLPVPVSVTLMTTPPAVGDGLTYHGVADHLLGGPTKAPVALSIASLGTIGQPSYLSALVTYSSASATSGAPTEIGPDKVLAVTKVRWSVPVRQTNVHPVDGGSRAYASGSVTSKTASGAPRRYLVAPGDTTAVVAQRFGVSTQDLIWLNADLEVFGKQQYLYASTTLNLDPDSL